MGPLFALALALTIALGTTVLFCYGVWLLVRYPTIAKKRFDHIARALHVTRHEHNPLITSEHSWEEQGVLNPGAIDIDGTMHLFYRAIGKDGVSRIGYATSDSGTKFDRLPYPVFALSGEDPEAAAARRTHMPQHSGLLASGGSWSGTEDPRAVAIDDTVYLTFSAFGGWDSLRMGVTTLPVSDLKQQRWAWTPPVFLSPPGQVHKNWVLFPEKINGKFAVLHSLHSGSRDRVLIDYLDSLDEAPAGGIESPYRPKADTEAWDSTLRGAGPPPMRTPEGWLLFYHAIDAREPSRYKIGALLLDLNDPTKIVARSASPVLVPDARYENEGAKSGVVYACGAVVRDDEVHVFYGGADSVICSARHSLDALLKQLTTPAARDLSRRPLFGMPVIA